MKHYEVWFCGCGRIHIMPHSEFDWMKEDYKNRSIIRICGNCGAAFKTFLTESFEEGFDVNSVDLRDDKVNEVKNSKLYYSKGIKVYMKSGKEADTKQNGYFANCEEWEYENGNSYQPIQYAEEERKDWATVDTKRLIDDVKRHYKEDADDILNSISGYSVKIHWKDTAYEREWNK